MTSVISFFAVSIFIFIAILALAAVLAELRDVLLGEKDD